MPETKTGKSVLAGKWRLIDNVAERRLG